jgi:hypothetical protein
MRTTRIAFASAALAATLAVTACGTPASPPDSAGTDTTAVPVVGSVTPTPTSTDTGGGGNGGGGGGGSGGGGGGGSWPSPEDCISYNANTLTKQYAAGVTAIVSGGVEIIRVYGGPGEFNGDHALAVAKRFTKVCFIGRNNHRDNATEYVFEYWRDPSGIDTSLPDEDYEYCSSYDRTNLVHDDMGNGDGWRVRDDDHILQIFNTEQDAINGKLVLGKYDRICEVDSMTPGDEYPADITYA